MMVMEMRMSYKTDFVGVVSGCLKFRCQAIYFA